MKNVDAGAAKELMSYLVKLQSSLPDVNKYVLSFLSKKYSSLLKKLFKEKKFQMTRSP